MLAGSEGTRTGLKVRNTFAYFGEYNDKNNFDIDLRGADGMGNQKFAGTAIDFFNVSKVKAGALSLERYALRLMRTMRTTRVLASAFVWRAIQIQTTIQQPRIQQNRAMALSMTSL